MLYEYYMKYVVLFDNKNNSYIFLIRIFLVYITASEFLRHISMYILPVLVHELMSPGNTYKKIGKLL